MCLAVVTHRLTGIGYKVFFLTKQNQLIGARYTLGSSYRKNIWIHDTNDSILREGLINYPAGFHIYEKLEDARKQKNGGYSVKYVIHKVKYKNVVCVGTQDPTFRTYNNSAEQAPVIIAKSMRILEEVQ